MSKYLKCPKCGKESIELRKWQLDRVLGFQNRLCANKVKYSKEGFKSLYERSEELIISLGFYTHQE